MKMFITRFPNNCGVKYSNIYVATLLYQVARDTCNNLMLQGIVSALFIILMMA